MKSICQQWLWLLLLVGAAKGFQLVTKRQNGDGSPDEDTNDDTTTDPNATIPADAQFIALVDWMQRNGGRVDERIGVTGDLDGTARGVVALQDIEAGSEIIFCPWTLVLGTIGNTSQVPSEHCDVLNFYAEQVRAGKDSFWYPYLSMDDSIHARVPTIWQASTLKELQGLLPDTDAASLTHWFSRNCAGGTPFDLLDQAAQQSLLAAVTRSAGLRFLPVFDLLNHHNGKLNTRSHASVDGNSVFATVDIPRGSEMFNSYRGGQTTSSEIYRRYGFVESWPQQWAWKDTTTAREERFLLLPTNTVAIYPSMEMTEQIGVTAIPLATFVADAERHNLQLETGKLVDFLGSSQRFLESFPTTVEEDKGILEQLLVEQQSNLLTDEGNPHELTDRISAIGYRISFKEAVGTALRVAEGSIANREL